MTGRGSVDRREGALVVKQNVSIASTQKGFKAKALRYIEESRLGLRSVKSGRQRSAIASGSALSLGFMADESPISARNDAQIGLY